MIMKIGFEIVLVRTFFLRKCVVVAKYQQVTKCGHYLSIEKIVSINTVY